MAFADETFQVRARTIESEGGKLDLSAGEIDRQEDGAKIKFTVSRHKYLELTFELKADGISKILLKSEMLPVDDDSAGVAACGWYLSSARCTTGPYAGSGGIPCANGKPPYLYWDFARAWFQNGLIMIRRVDVDAAGGHAQRRLSTAPSTPGSA